MTDNRFQPGEVGAPMLQVVGAREHVRLPGLGLDPMPARIDTGARTSSLHAVNIHVEGGDVLFDAVLEEGGFAPCRSHLVEWRWVKDSGGHPTLRPVIRTLIVLGAHAWEDEVTLADRDGLRHRVLIGRRALWGRFVVDVSASYIQGPPEGEGGVPA